MLKPIEFAVKAMKFIAFLLETTQNTKLVDLYLDQEIKLVALEKD